MENPYEGPKNIEPAKRRWSVSNPARGWLLLTLGVLASVINSQMFVAFNCGCWAAAVFGCDCCPPNPQGEFLGEALLVGLVCGALSLGCQIWVLAIGNPIQRILVPLVAVLLFGPHLLIAIAARTPPGP